MDIEYPRKIKAISAAGFPEQDRISYDLLTRVLEERIIDYKLKQYEMPISQMRGVQNSLADLPNAVPLDSVHHYDDYIAHLHQFARVFRQTIAVLKRGKKDGLMPPRVLLDQVPAQRQGVIAENPFVEPAKKFPDSIRAADQKRLTTEISAVVSAEVLPAFQNFADFISKD